jgi:hydroxymethylpyrimidine/phosphomethylpyrimidine kinase
MSSLPPVVLTFAASDPTGGAGLQADILAIAALGCHPISVVTALTVQNTSGVLAMRAVEASLVLEQARRVLADIPVAAFKTGVLASPENVRAIAALLAEYPEVPLVVDPVLASGRGDALASEEVVLAIKEKLMPLATVATPNSIEAQRLGGAPRLLELGCRFVLVTGSHADTAEVVNTLYDAGGVAREDRWPRLPGSYHGSGCTLASAIAASMAKGSDVRQAVRLAQEYTWKALAGGFRPGAGQFIPNRLFAR